MYEDGYDIRGVCQYCTNNILKSEFYIFINGKYYCSNYCFRNLEFDLKEDNVNRTVCKRR